MRITNFMNARVNTTLQKLLVLAAPACLALLLVAMQATPCNADTIFDSFDSPVGGQTATTGTSVRATADTPSVIALGATPGSARRALWAFGGTGTVNVSAGVWDIPSLTQTHVEYGTGDQVGAPGPYNSMNLDLSAYDGFRLDFNSWTYNSGANQISQMSLYTGSTDGIANSGTNRYANKPAFVNSATPFSVTYLWSDFAGLTGTELMDIDGLWTSIGQGQGGNVFTTQVSQIVLVGGPVPEPSSIVLAGFGLVGLGWFGIRRRKG